MTLFDCIETSVCIFSACGENFTLSWHNMTCVISLSREIVSCFCNLS